MTSAEMVSQAAKARRDRKFALAVRLYNEAAVEFEAKGFWAIPKRLRECAADCQVWAEKLEG